MPDSDNAMPDEGHVVTALKMDYVHLPVPFEAPEINHLRKFIRIMRAYSGHKVWVHCVLNYRVSAFLYHYMRVMEGATVAQAKRLSSHPVGLILQIDKIPVVEWFTENIK